MRLPFFKFFFDVLYCFFFVQGHPVDQGNSKKSGAGSS